MKKINHVIAFTHVSRSFQCFYEHHGKIQTRKTVVINNNWEPTICQALYVALMNQQQVIYKIQSKREKIKLVSKSNAMMSRLWQ